jgi:predicted dehydrogenase
VKVRWGILGCGNIARHAIAPAIRWSSNGELAAIGSRTFDVARRLCSELAAPRPHGSYESLLRDAEVDAIYVGLPNGLHAEWCLAAADAGKHVLCEKSLTLDAATAKRMRDAFTARRLRLVEGFMYRHHPQWGAVQALLRDGAIGAPKLVRATFCGTLLREDDHRWSKTLGGGALFDLTCYGVNVARWIFGREPRRVSALGAMIAEGVDASSAAVLDFGDGGLATVSGSLASTPEQSLVISGTDGHIEVVRPFAPEWNATTIEVVRAAGHRRIEIGGANQFLHQVEHFASLVLDPARPLDPAEDGVLNVAACEAIARSLREGRAVDVEP